MQEYMRTPCGVVLCVDSFQDGTPKGLLYHGYTEKAIPFSCLERAFQEMEALYDSLRYPFQGTELRSFVPPKKNQSEKRMDRVMSDKELLRKHGERGTFVVQVQYRQNSSWQGLVTWTEKHKTVPFRSALELIKLIDGVLSQEDEEETKVSLLDGEE